MGEIKIPDMKTFRKKIQFISRLLILICFFQSCSVYHSKTVSADKAAESNKKLKLTTATDKVYKFRQLERDNTGIYGIAKKRSKAAKNIAGHIVESNYEGEFVKIAIPENLIKNIRLKNNTLSVVLTSASVMVLLLPIIGDRGPGSPF